MPAPLIARHVTKHYGALTAVDGVSLDVQAGEIFGVLGPNRAGKTTLLEMLEGLRRPDASSITVLGLDVLGKPQRVKSLIGIQL